MNCIYIRRKEKEDGNPKKIENRKRQHPRKKNTRAKSRTITTITKQNKNKTKQKQRPFGDATFSETIPQANKYTIMFSAMDWKVMI